jgi:glycerol-3-phosphate acyltransferase PlsY
MIKVAYFCIVGIVAYLLGSISTSLVVCRLTGQQDIRTQGSGNAGTTNTLRVMGKKAALIVLIGDILKGVLAGAVGRLLLGQIGAYFGALMGVVGHMYPLYFGFKGGKGVATIAGALLAIHPLLFALELGTFILTFLVWRTVSISSLLSALVAPAVVWFVTHDPWQTFFLTALALLIIFNHRTNIVRIVKGQEPKTSFKK